MKTKHKPRKATRKNKKKNKSPKAGVKKELAPVYFKMNLK